MFWLYDIFSSRRSKLTKERRRGSAAVKGLGIALLVTVIPTIYFLSEDFNSAMVGPEFDFVFSVILAFLISAVWVMYLRKLDIYEPEPWWAIALVFVMSCITIWGVYPLSTLFGSTGWRMGQGFLSDLLYCIIVIGGVEELVKIIPVLIIIRYTKVVNEPFDYILYGSVSALGFAFIENSMYLERFELYALHARTFMASVAHMTFTSLVAYGLMLNKYNSEGRKYPVIFFFVAAAVSHGLYDLWLFEPLPFDTEWLTLIFFLITVHFWFKMKNNAINISTFYSPKIHFVNGEMKRRLLLSVLILLTIGILFISLRHGARNASAYMLRSLFIYGYFAIYLVFSIDKFKVIRGYVGRFDLTFDALLPRSKEHHHILGMDLQLSGLLPARSADRKLLSPLMPFEGSTERRVVVIDDKQAWFVLRLREPLNLDQVDGEQILIRPLDTTTDLYEEMAPVRLALIRKDVDPDKPEFSKQELAWIGTCFSTPIVGTT